MAEPLRSHTDLRGEALVERVLELLERVGLKEEHLYRCAHEFSGGRCWRIAVAGALALNPKFIVLDEPTSALDVSVQAQILDLLQELQGEFGLTYNRTRMALWYCLEVILRPGAVNCLY